MKKLALVTGATSGIGKATAMLLAENGYSLILTGRRAELLESVKKEAEIKHKTEVLALNFDVRDKEAVASAVESLPERWRKIDVLINNAGLAVGLNHIQDGVIDDWDRMIDTNIKGLLYITRAIVPLMIERGSGHIINIGSIAGTEVYENGNVYCASKHAVEAITKGMRIDLLKEGIKVSGIRPGMVETEFSSVRYKGDDELAKKTYQGISPLFAEDIAQTILFVLNRPAHVNINDLVIMPTAQASATYVNRVVQ
ncbi:SDR family oxidoreductase [Williamwhitmania taraxaci]|uniref:NADP-dependent 3-hydroxy acid dehydrogenase YdfG n=1 Tax=Williamwhitmania taraxaci TaxID=1640674 RepID=A0A1G6GJ33_9BACT|nr:SDR family oxidoreductase [Williamwhitmania taraxaci]SDB81755.1 NADP-dependent 3-hydroxy acid dehydrogenase YdfG [Williamwhitmania taraxaci]